MVERRWHNGTNEGPCTEKETSPMGVIFPDMGGGGGGGEGVMVGGRMYAGDGVT